MNCIFNKTILLKMDNNFILNLIENNSIILTDNLMEYMCVLDSNELENYTESWKYNRNLNSDKINEIKLIIKDKIILDTVHFFIQMKVN